MRFVLSYAGHTPKPKPNTKWQEVVLSFGTPRLTNKQSCVRGADVNKADDDGSTPVLTSSQYGHALVLSALLAAGGDVSKTRTSGPDKGASALWAAAFSGRSECLQQLLSAGCDVNSCTDDGCSPLDIATDGGHADMVQQLLLAGATPSHVAAASTSSSTQ